MGQGHVLIQVKDGPGRKLATLDTDQVPSGGPLGDALFGAHVLLLEHLPNAAHL